MRLRVDHLCVYIYICACLQIQVIDKAVDEGVADKKEIGTAVRVRPFCVSLSLSLSLSFSLSVYVCVCV